MEEQIQELLNSIPQGVTYTTFPEVKISYQRIFLKNGLTVLRNCLLTKMSLLNFVLPNCFVRGG